MDVLWSKLLVMGLLGVVSLVVGFVPLMARSYSAVESARKRTVLSVLLCFGGGVLLATSMVHMLPEVRAALDESGVDLHDAPLAEILFCLGFFVLYFVEELVHVMCDPKLHQHPCPETVHKVFTVHRESCAALHDGMQIEAMASNAGASRVRGSLGSAQSAPSYHTFVDQQGNGHGNGMVGHGPHFDQDVEEGGNGHDHSGVRDLFTALALSLHSVTEGLAVGLEEDAAGVWQLFAAVATHKYVMAFCFGIQLLASSAASKRYSMYMVIWALMSPLGVGIGTAITEGSAGTDTNTPAYWISIAVLQALAGGTIVYVVVFEVLQHERAKSVSGLLQFASVVVGFGVMVLVEIFAPHEHGHDEGAHNHTQPILASHL